MAKRRQGVDGHPKRREAKAHDAEVREAEAAEPLRPEAAPENAANEAARETARTVVEREASAGGSGGEISAAKPATEGSRSDGRIVGDYHPPKRQKLKPKAYEAELARLTIELVKLQEWIRAQGLKVVVLVEGRDAAGKGGVIKTIAAGMNPRICRVVALGVPTERQKTQWYFQRYVAELPAAGEMVLFDRSWYNRAGVEHVMGFCTQKEYEEFLRSCPEFERMLIRSGIVLLKFWFSVSDDEQERRFQARLDDPTKRWKLSPMDVTARSKWVEYSKAKDAMFASTDIPEAPWWVVEADDKKRARLNTIAHILRLIPYEDLTPESIALPPRQTDDGYVRPPLATQHFVPDKY